MGAVVKAFDATRSIADDGQRLTMLSMVASVARALMLQAAADMRAILALSPAIRAAITQADARKGGAS
jgi:excinuclease UvrABC ATPase subunit